MKPSNSLAAAWSLAVITLLCLLLSLSCCSRDPAAGPGPGVQPGVQPVGPTGGAAGYEQPPQMVEALERGAAEGKIVMVELYDRTCEYCTAMDRVLEKDTVQEALAPLVTVRIGVEDRGVIGNFGLTQSPSYLFFKPDGTFMEPYLDGYRSSRRLADEIENFKLLAAGQPVKELKKDFHRDFGKG